ncbi:hypothetical protein PHET_00355 [Paragonimus heterotremus]|uniref:Uncharacterized protein n=1 Tax=Paragonimus heterotremus TaxID=100268 RepID=A0A8J4T704_9TREM|nr:hypothetical protein PHET_00355 [Paragonimus heterotremus]
MAWECRSTGSCNAQGCGRKHHRPLYSDSSVTVAEEAAIVTSRHAVGFHLNHPQTDPIVPVTVPWGENIVHTSAFLDNGSDCTLTDESLVTERSQRQLKLCALNGETMFESVAVQLDVASSDSKRADVVS